MALTENRIQLDVYNLQKSYKDFTLQIKEFHARNTEIIGLVGNNGAGKTTFLRLLLDLVMPENGEIYSNQISITLSEHWKEYTGSFLDEDFLISFLTPMEFFKFISNVYDITYEELNKRLLKYEQFLNIDLNIKKFIRDFSTGNKVKIGIVSTLITNPRVVVLDEPFNYLDPTSQNYLSLILRNFHKTEDSCIILSSHDLTHISELCTRVIIIDNGQIIKDLRNDSPSQLSMELKEYFMV
jgi:ABC-2 type transport system ATP-binding protein